MSTGDCFFAKLILRTDQFVLRLREALLRQRNETTGANGF
jgi:hypothetical protein